MLLQNRQHHGHGREEEAQSPPSTATNRRLGATSLPSPALPGDARPPSIPKTERGAQVILMRRMRWEGGDPQQNGTQFESPADVPSRPPRRGRSTWRPSVHFMVGVGAGFIFVLGGEEG